jgi:hypothetical protein
MTKSALIDKVLFFYGDMKDILFEEYSNENSVLNDLVL